MVLAYLRGLLKPDYKNGSRSMAREHLVLQALQYETTAHSLENQTMLQAAFASFIQPAKVPEMMRRMMNSLKRMGELRELNVHWKGVDEAEESYHSLIKLYEAMEKAGIIKDEQEE